MPEIVGTSCLALRAVTASAPDGTRLLDDVSFNAERGQLVSVVGPTGAGKTSLARVLTGTVPIESGVRRVEGSVAFVPQHDTLHMGLPLHRALEYSAALRLTDADERAARVASVMAELGLERHADTVVRDLSVGQRKRATVAAQLLGDPDVIVLDEPTAGLDPGYERVVRDMLRKLADAGRTVVTVTHSVDTLQASDRVLFLAAGGSVAFFGTPKEAAKYFGLKHPADVFLALDTAPQHFWQTKFRGSTQFQRYLAGDVEPAAPTPRPRSGGRGFLAHTALFVKRHVELLARDRRHAALLALQAPVIGALLWAVLPADGLAPSEAREFSARAAIVVMFLVLSTTWLGVTNAVREIVKEQAIVRAEGAAGMTAASYITAKALSVGTITVLQAAVITFIATLRQSPPSGGAVLALVAIAGASGLAACALGLMISAWAKSADKALAVLPVALVLQLVLAGGWAEDARMPLVGVVRSLVGARWGMAAMEATLRGDTANGWIALAALTLLTGGALGTAMWRIRLLTRAAGEPAFVAPTISRRSLTGIGTAAAVGLSLAAGGTGVLAFVSGQPAANIRVASSPVTTAAPRSADAPTRTTTVVAAPVTTPTAVAMAAPPVTAAPKPKPIAAVREVLPDTPPMSIPVDQETPTPVVTTPPVTPTTTPTTTVTTNPLQQLINLFNPFAPRSDR
ncbi:MAG: ATP-binding cassette domain-containing protein [Acidimicrobiales bacterium]|nr:ATP-binding cassette domain-containing protein [Acidimicrobiales bacterium]